MEGTTVVIVVAAMIVIGIGAIIADAILLRKKFQESRKYDNAISRIMKNYKHITMDLVLAERFLEALRYNKDTTLVIYKGESGPESFVLVIKKKDDTENIDVGREPKWTATSENYDAVRREMREYVVQNITR